MLDFFSKGQEKDLLPEIPIRDVLDGVALLKDGRAETGIKLTLPAALALPDIDSFIKHIKAALHATPDHSRLRFVVQIGESDERKLHDYKASIRPPEELARVLARSRHEYYHYLWRQGYVSTWTCHCSVTVGNKRGKNVLSYPTEIIDRAHRIRMRLKRSFEQIGFQPKDVSTQDVFEIVFRYLNPALNKVTLGTYESTYQVYPKKVIKRDDGIRPPSFASQVAKSTPHNSRFSYMQIGDTFVKMLYMNAIPDGTFVGMGNLLLKTGIKQSLIIDFTHIPQDEALARVKRRNTRLYATANSEGFQDADVDEALNQGRALSRHIMVTGDHQFHVSCALVLTAEDLDAVNDAATTALSAMANIPGNPFTLADAGVLGPWLDHIPFSGGSFCEAPTLVETNCAHFIPLSGTYEGSKDAVALYHTRSGALVSITCFDQRNKNPHVLYLGETRSGKTFAAQYQMYEELKDPSREAIIIDRGLSWSNLVHAHDGVVIKIEPGGTSINPFELEVGQLKPTEAQKSVLARIIRAMAPSGDETLEAWEDTIISSAIEQAYDAHLEERLDDEDNPYHVLQSFTLSGFVDVLLNLSEIGNRPAKDKDHEVAHSLATRLQRWTGDSPLGKFIDRPTSLPAVDKRVVLYETSAFEDMPGLDAVAMMLIQGEIWRRARNNYQKKLILAIDEFWAIAKNPHSLALTVELARRGAKEGIALWALTHSVKDLVGPGKEALLGAFNSYFLVRLSGEHDLLQEYLQLPKEYIAVFQTLTREIPSYNEMLYVARRDAGLEGEVLILRPSRADYWMSTNHNDDLARIAALEEKLGSRHAAIAELSGLAEELVL